MGAIEDLRAIDALMRKQEGQESAKWVSALFELDDRVKALEDSAGRSIPYGPGPIQPIILKYNPPQPAQNDEALEDKCLAIICEWQTSPMTNTELARKIIAAVRGKS